MEKFVNFWDKFGILVRHCEHSQNAKQSIIAQGAIFWHKFAFKNATKSRSGLLRRLPRLAMTNKRFNFMGIFVNLREIYEII